MRFVKFISGISLIIVLLISYMTYGDSYLFGTYLSIKEAKKKWSSIEFNASEFTKSSEQKKGAMSVNLIEKKIYKNKPMSVVRAEMGDPDSYFFSDTIYAYEITPPEEGKEQWQLIFIPDDKLEKVKEIKIHKKCCYKSPFK